MKPFFLVLILCSGVWAQAQTSSIDLFNQIKNAYTAQLWDKTETLGQKYRDSYADSLQIEDVYFLEGAALYHAKNYTKSLDILQKLKRAYPQGKYLSRISYWMGLDYFYIEQFDQAKLMFLNQSNYQDQTPFYPRNLFYLGLVEEKAGRSIEACKAFSDYLGQKGEPLYRSQATLHWGDLLQVSNPDEAIKIWEQAVVVEDCPLIGILGQRIVALLLKRQLNQQALDWSTKLLTKNLDELKSICFYAAQAAQALGDKKKAHEYLLLGIKAGPPDDVRQKIYYNLGFLALDKEKDLLGFWEKASQGPDLSLAYEAVTQQSDLLSKAGKSKQAVDLLQNWYSLHKGIKEADGLFWNCARLSYQSGDSSQALKYLQVILDQYPLSLQKGEALYLMGLIYVQRGEALRGEGYYYKILQTASGELYQRALLARGIAFYDAGKLDLAQASLERLLKEVPDSTWAGQGWFTLAKVNLAQGRLEDSKADFIKASDLLTNEDREKTLYSLGDVLIRLKDWNNAILTWNNYLAAFPNSPQSIQVLYLKAWCLAQQSSWDKALDIWNEGLSNFPNRLTEEWWERAAEAKLMLGRPLESFKYLTDLAKHFKNAPEEVAQAYIKWAFAAQSQGQTDAAYEAYKVVIDQYPLTKAAQIALPKSATSLVNQGDPQKALERYRLYFTQYGTTNQAAYVASSASSLLQTNPKTFDQLYSESKTWTLAPFVRTSFDLIWWKSRIDSNSQEALKALQDIAAQAPWVSQRAEALIIAGRWATRQAQYDLAKDYLNGALTLGEDTGVFEARTALAELAEKQGRKEDAARLYETSDRLGGDQIPEEFRLNNLNKALNLWKELEKIDDQKRVESRINSLNANLNKL